MGNLLKKHSRLENSKFISTKIFTNDKSFNLFIKVLLENIHKWPAKCKIMNVFFCANFPLYGIM